MLFEKSHPGINVEVTLQADGAVQRRAQHGARRWRRTRRDRLERGHVHSTAARSKQIIALDRKVPIGG